MLPDLGYFVALLGCTQLAIDYEREQFSLCTKLLSYSVHEAVHLELL